MNPRDSDKNLCSPKFMKIAGKGFTFVTHYNLVHKFIPMQQAMKSPDAKAAVDQVKTKKMLFWKHKETNIKSTLLH